MEQYEGGYEYREQPEKNVLGIVGFALSFCTGPIGLILSLIALKDRPRGFAIAGVIISIISTVVLVLVGWGIAWGARIGMSMVGIAQDYAAISRAVGSYQSTNNGQLPSDLSVLGLSAETTTDPWGTAYRFEASGDDGSWTLITAGMDKTFDTRDDARLGSGLSEDDVVDQMEESVEGHFEEKFGQ